MFENIDIGHHHQEGEEREDQEIFHRQRVSGAIVGRFALFRRGKHERFVGVAKSLGDERHDHRDFHCAPVDAELHNAFVTRNQLGEENLIDGLVQNPRNPEHQNGPGVGKHGAYQTAVDAPFHTEELFPKTEGDQSGANQIDEEHMAHFYFPPFDEMRENDEEKKIEEDVERNEAKFEHGKLHRSALITEITERHCLKSVESHHCGHHPHVVRVIGVAHLCRKSGEESKHEGEKQQSHAAHDRQHGGVHFFRVFYVVAVDEAKERSLHAESENHEQQRRVRIHVGDHPVAAARRREDMRVEREEQIIEKAPHNGAHAIDGRVFGQRFQRSHVCDEKGGNLSLRSADRCPHTSGRCRSVGVNQKKRRSSASRTRPISAFCWVTGIRTQNDRTKTCSVTITP